MGDHRPSLRPALLRYAPAAGGGHPGHDPARPQGLEPFGPDTAAVITDGRLPAVAAKKMLGTPRVSTFGLGQLSFALTLTASTTAFGSTFSTTGLPMTEFVSRIPMSKRYSIELLKKTC
nr:hypothetical protein GCM10020185_63670 [Pseudomonas brassicacearum subsp. brassicacearum]